jgi:protein-S-isoprenylcysteine O-methyltransferase Ste14
MQATSFEFRYRFLIMGCLFALAFSCYWLDHRNAAVAFLAFVTSHSIRLDTSGRKWALQAIFAIAALLGAFAALLRTWAAAYLRSGIVHDPAMHSTELVADGPYRHVRNPLYLGAIMLAVGMGMLASRLGWIVLVIGVWIFTYRLIRREESAMQREQGERFDAYRAKVPRLLMSLRPKVPPGNGIPRWRQAFLGESFCWAFALGTCVFALTLNIVYADCVFVLGFVIGVVLRQVSHRLIAS